MMVTITILALAVVVEAAIRKIIIEHSTRTVPVRQRAGRQKSRKDSLRTPDGDSGV
ncbi:MAG: hypothetical protein NNA22_09755 [Nitrospira sp.]|nr:hypothetical protein [Nitrospira sp.]